MANIMKNNVLYYYQHSLKGGFKGFELAIEIS